MTAIPLKPILKAAFEEVTDETIRKMEKSAKLIQNRGVRVTFVETAGVDLDGQVQWDKQGNVRVMARAGGIFPVSGVPVDGSADVAVGRAFEVDGTMDVKIRTESMVRVEPFAKE